MVNKRVDEKMRTTHELLDLEQRINDELRLTQGIHKTFSIKLRFNDLYTNKHYTDIDDEVFFPKKVYTYGRYCSRYYHI